MTGAQGTATGNRDTGSLQALRDALLERGPGRADLPLDGVIVLDFSKILAGPLCTQYMGELGATVIKIETAEGGDDTRAWPPFTGGNGTVFLSVNRNKRSLALDLRSPRGLALAHRLARVADVAIENFSPGVAERLRIDHASLSEINPRLVYCSISGFGSVGPLSAGKGYDVILQAFSGMLSITGEEGGPPVRAAYSPVDQATGLHAVIGILGGLMRQARTGRGMKVEASLFDSSLSFLAYVLQGYWERGVDPRPAGSGHESLCPYQSFETADKPMMLGIANDALWRRFCALVARPELVDDPRFVSGAARVAHRAETVELVQDILRTRTRAQWLGLLDQAGIPCSPIHAISELAAHPHTAASGMTFDYGGGPAPTMRRPCAACRSRCASTASACGQYGPRRKWASTAWRYWGRWGCRGKRSTAWLPGALWDGAATRRETARCRPVDRNTASRRPDNARHMQKALVIATALAALSAPLLSIVTFAGAPLAFILN